MNARRPRREKLPLLPLWEVLDHLATEARRLGAHSYLLDMLDAIDHDLTADDERRPELLAAVAELAEHFTAVIDVTRRCATLIDHEVMPDRLVHDPTLKYLTTAMQNDPRAGDFDRR